MNTITPSFIKNTVENVSGIEDLSRYVRREGISTDQVCSIQVKPGIPTKTTKHTGINC